MPQLNQLPDIWWSQLFWLVVVFGIIFFAIIPFVVTRIVGLPVSSWQRYRW